MTSDLQTDTNEKGGRGVGRRLLITLAAVLVVAGLVFGGYLYGRDHPATNPIGGPVTTAPVTTTPTTAATTLPSSSSCDSGSSCLNITDKAGDGVSVTLDGEIPVSSCDAEKVGGGAYLVALSFTNSGTTILGTDSDSYADAVTLIDASSTAYSENYGGSCGYQGAPVAFSICKNSAYILDLTPGSKAVWCAMVNFPATSTLEKVQFNATDFFSPAFSQSGIDNAATWNVGSS